MAEQTFASHLSEIRSRLLQSLMWLLIGTAIGYYYREPIIEFITSPYHQPIYYTTLTGGFELIITVSLYTGIVFAIPFMTYHLIRFLEPAMSAGAKQSIVGFVAGSGILTAAAIAFAYFIIIPGTFRFLNSFTNSNIQSLVSSSSYLSFMTTYFLFTTLVFQLPLVILIIDRFSPLRIRQLMAYQSYVIIASFILAAIVTPSADPFNQTLLAAPIIVLYQVSILSVWLAHRRKKYRLKSG